MSLFRALSALEFPSSSALGVIVLALALASSGGCASSQSSLDEEESVRRNAVAPTAVFLRADREHVGVVDARTTIPEMLCLELLEGAADIGFTIRFDDAVVAGSLVVFDSMGGFGLSEPSVRSERRVEAGDAVVEVLDRFDAGRPAACFELRVSEGSSLYRARWRHR